MRQLLFIALLGPVAGYAADEAPAPASAPAAVAAAPAASTPRQICHREAPLGSNRPVTVCHNVNDPNDPNASRTAEDLTRQMNQSSGIIGRAGSH